MVRRLQLKKRWRLMLGCGIVVFGLLWWLTSAIGVPQVRRAIVESMPVSPSFTDVSREALPKVLGPVYYCRAAAWAPFLIQVEFGWNSGPLRGDGGAALYVWLFGLRFRACEYSHWAV